MKQLLAITITLFYLPLLAHDVDYGKILLKRWQLSNNQEVEGSLLMCKNGEVYIQDAKDQVVHYPLNNFTAKDQEYVNQRYATIARLATESPLNKNLRENQAGSCLLYTSPSPRDLSTSRMPSSA